MNFLNFRKYQEQAKRTMPSDLCYEEMLVMLAMGLAGESGEVLELIKKWRFHGHELDKARLADELGDVMWYIANLANELKMSLENVCKANIIKLRKRYPEGFSKERSKNRES